MRDHNEAMRLADSVHEMNNASYMTAIANLNEKKRQQAERIAELEKEIADLHTTMFAAAVEIHEHWDAHCDAEGYGPANLMHRLERGIASQYGYDAKTLQRIEADRDQLQAEVLEQARLNGMGAERELALMAERDQHQATATALIALLADIRKACGDNGKRMQPELVEFIGSMKAERDQLMADAERYQWLREHSYIEITCKSPRDPSWTPQQLDAAIDAARTTHKETE